MLIVCTTESASWPFDAEKVTDRVIVLIVGVDNLSLSIYPYLPLQETFLVLDVDELRRNIIQCELLTARCASVCADELTEERRSDEYFMDWGSHGGYVYPASLGHRFVHKWFRTQ